MSRAVDLSFLILAVQAESAIIQPYTDRLGHKMTLAQQGGEIGKKAAYERQDVALAV